MTIHWCGAGLSSGPGLRRLIEAGHDVVVRDRDLDRAGDLVGDLTDRIEDFDLEGMTASLGNGDVVVSMFPADWHVPLAEAAIDRGAHFVGSSYISPQMRALDEAARDAGVALVNEVGLDPGIDHLMAHDLVAAWKASPAYRGDAAISFRSHCGGIPRESNALRYKFSWSPVGVLRALMSPARCIRDFTELSVTRPWNALTRFDAPQPVNETFEVYPNRDSLPFMAEYRFEPSWRIKEFVRGTLRPNGWADAWQPVFDRLEALGADPDPEVAAMAEELWTGNAYTEGEPDRVVLVVSLKAEHKGRAVWHRSWVLDAWGDARGSAMARLVSGTVGLAAGAVLTREIPAGVHGAPSDARLVRRWLTEVDHWAQHMQVVDHLK